MAKKGMIEREKKRQNLVSKYKNKRIEIKTLSKKSSPAQQFVLAAKMSNFPRNSAPTRLRNRCFVTGRSKGYSRDFGLSRHVLREMAYQGLLPGVTKASW
uniref:Small ribosomal subunit protein uS14c n=1 Tax=Monomastix sp. (strain OKE-1) TaxID=141716 RepID=C0JWM4_MONSK|nr:ribosomal protein S14 [Monomastix sp. OKE-1]ACK36885.1 ribosomal protein S14 [Monomastix sp. OKE-1]